MPDFKIMRGTPIDVHHHLRMEYDYTNQMAAIGMEYHDKPINIHYPILMPIEGHNLGSERFYFNINDKDFYYCDDEGTAMNKKDLVPVYITDFDIECDDVDNISLEDESQIPRAYKNLKAFKERGFVSERLEIQWKLDHYLFDLEHWMLDNMNEPFIFVLGLTTDRVFSMSYEDDFDTGEESIEGCSFIEYSASVAFEDETDAMGFKLKFI